MMYFVFYRTPVQGSLTVFAFVLSTTILFPMMYFVVYRTPVQGSLTVFAFVLSKLSKNNFVAVVSSTFRAGPQYSYYLGSLRRGLSFKFGRSCRLSA